MLVTIKGIEVHAFHGVLPEEKESGQRFLIDIRLELPAPASDELGFTVDYAEVAAAVARVATGERFDLIESLAARIADHLLTLERVSAATVTVSKPDAPMPVRVESVGVTETRRRGGSRGYFTD